MSLLFFECIFEVIRFVAIMIKMPTNRPTIIGMMKCWVCFSFACSIAGINKEKMLAESMMPEDRLSVIEFSVGEKDLNRYIKAQPRVVARKGAANAIVISNCWLIENFLVAVYGKKVFCVNGVNGLKKMVWKNNKKLTKNRQKCKNNAILMQKIGIFAVFFQTK